MELEAICARVDGLLELRRAAEAAELLRGAVAEYPDAMPVWHRIAHAQLLLGQFDFAASAAQRVIELAPEHPDGYIMRGYLHSLQDRPVQAAEFLRQAVRVAPEMWQPHVELARALLKVRGMEAEALDVAGTAASLAPEEAVPHAVFGEALLRAQKPQEARAALQRSLAIDPQDADALRLLGEAEIEAGRMVTGIHRLRDATVADPRDAEIPARMQSAVLNPTGWVVLFAALSTIALQIWFLAKWTPGPEALGAVRVVAWVSLGILMLLGTAIGARVAQLDASVRAHVLRAFIRRDNGRTSLAVGSFSLVFLLVFGFAPTPVMRVFAFVPVPFEALLLLGAVTLLVPGLRLSARQARKARKQKAAAQRQEVRERLHSNR
ncbi:tetratricopeptide repeat protein [Actinomadura gamaensis]|uniref:Tetratricopeptide repeat protein n=1 Tax=Actinomadura gamaensis TaxID=1763541 RepID=A0ABV9U2N2_9ACTN